MAAPATPIRAITNSLSLRSTPSVPPASKTYEPLVKAVLRHRLIFRIFVFSALFTWGAAAVKGLWVQGGLSKLGFSATLLSPISPALLILAAGTWSLGVLPVLVLRKTYLTATPTISSSPSQVFFAAQTKASTIHALLTHLASAAIFMIIHVLTTYLYASAFEIDLGLTLFVRSKRHPYYLNGRTLYVLSSQLTVALFYLSRNIMLDRFTVRWTATLLGAETRNYRLAKLLTSSITMAILVAISTSVNTVIFGLGRSLVLPILFRLPIIPRFLKPFTAHFLRGPLSFSLLFRNWSLIQSSYNLALFTVLNWEFAEAVFDTYVSEPLNVSRVTADPALSLTSGISSPSSYIQHFAFSELRALATDPSATGSSRRTALFSDQKYNPTIWSTLVRTSLLILGQDYQTLLRRGKPEPKPAVPVVENKDKKERPNIPSTPLVKTNVFKAGSSGRSPLKSALETLASDGVVTAAADELGSSQIPELFRSVMAPALTPAKPKDEGKTDATPAPKKIAAPSRWKAQAAREVQNVAEKYTPGWLAEVKLQVVDWWTRERLSRVVEGSLPNRKIDALLIESLSGFVCGSLTEDRYGVVQRDIPRILESFVSFLLAIEEYQSELLASNSKIANVSPGERAQMSKQELALLERSLEDFGKATEVLNEVGDALKAGIVQIVQTFGHRLAAFKFPPRIANKLQGFVDYS
ncbi:nucleoporin protein Ndc1-Nup [Cristinia sonorae]|uniref:Nucleoporin protein Ndc1-Nup n=1 Tax=Cristinia sonorae TaxID=1940300 RepID=A0A8K0UEL9_9AGAR|nr:nucleoporin protein Ndc1-Nup [Cristinia sonorae]